MSTAGKSHRGFTLIELLVVIGLIALLVSILLPALSKARQLAYKTQTMALLSGLSSDCEQYFTQFDAYPGPAPESVTTGSGGPKMSGTQNLLLGLCGTIYDSGQLPSPRPGNFNAQTVPGGGTFSDGTPEADAGNTLGPIDWSATPPRAYRAYYDPKPNAISPVASWTGNSGGIKGGAAGGWPYPTILDCYPDPLPILYFRATPQATGSITYDASYNVATTQTIFNEENTPGNSAPFHRLDNSEYLDAAALISPSGMSFVQGASSGISISNGQANADLNLAELVSGETASTTINSHGGFLLMAAGSSRIYGPNTANNNQKDTMFVFGGH